MTSPTSTEPIASAPARRPRRAATRWIEAAPAEPQAARRPLRDPLFEALFDSAPEGLLLCDSSGLVLGCNALAAALLGVGLNGVVGRPVTELLTQESREGNGDFALHSGNAVAASHETQDRPIDLRVTPVASATEGARWIVHVRELNDHDRTKRKLAFLANYDSLTGLPNRTLFRDRLAQAMQRARRSGRSMALMFIDLDRFKIVNDGLGHEVGDRLLCHVARALSHCLRGTDSLSRASDDEFTVSRLGGDEFTVIAEAIDSPEDAAHIAQRMLDALTAPLVVGAEEIVISASIGISMYPTDDIDLDGLIRHADMAMYRSKSLGRGTYSFYSDDLRAATAARVSLEGSLRRAIERHEFHLHYQPRASLKDGRVVGVEALLRWHRPGHGMVPPDRFISVLEDTGMILPVGAWVIRAACAQLAEWDRAGLPPLNLSVNLSARQLRHLHLGSLVHDSLRENYIEPHRLEIELTESLLMEDTDANRAVLENFRRIGVGLAIDDFGTGHSSLTYLKRFAIDALKIDRSFVQSLPDSSEDDAIARAVIALGRSMDMRVVAEGVETEAQAQALLQMGCDEIQGYLLSPPLGGADFAKWLAGIPRSRRSGHSGFGQVRETAPITLFSLMDDAP